MSKCYTTDLWTAKAKKWIIDYEENDRSQPFFMYLAYDASHAVLELPTQSYRKGGGLNGGLKWLNEPVHMINTASGIVDSYIYPEYANAGDDNGHNALSNKEDNYLSAKAYDITELKTEEKTYLEVDDLYNRKGIVTVVFSTGYVVSQRTFYWS